MRSSSLSIVLSFTLALVALSCGGAQPTAEAPPQADSSSDATSEPPVDDADPTEQEDAAPAADDTEDSGKPTTRGAAIVEIVKKNRDKVRACYDAALKESPDMKGNLVIHFKLDAEGIIAVAELVPDRSQITSPKVVECAIAALKGMSFPAHPEGMDTEVNYPFNFNPR